MKSSTGCNHASLQAGNPVRSYFFQCCLNHLKFVLWVKDYPSIVIARGFGHLEPVSLKLLLLRQQGVLSAPAIDASSSSSDKASSASRMAMASLMIFSIMGI